MPLALSGVQQPQHIDVPEVFVDVRIYRSPSLTWQSIIARDSWRERKFLGIRVLSSALFEYNMTITHSPMLLLVFSSLLDSRLYSVSCALMIVFGIYVSPPYSSFSCPQTLRLPCNGHESCSSGQGHAKLSNCRLDVP